MFSKNWPWYLWNLTELAVAISNSKYQYEFFFFNSFSQTKIALTRSTFKIGSEKTSINASSWSRPLAGLKLAMYILACLPTWLPTSMPLVYQPDYHPPACQPNCPSVNSFQQNNTFYIVKNRHIFLLKAVIHLPANLPAHLPACHLPCHLPAYLFPPACPPTYLATWPVATCPNTCLPAKLPGRRPANLPTKLPVICLPTYLPA